MPLFIVFEGGDGAGKTTQVRTLYRRLRRRGYPVILCQEPGSSLYGELLRGVLTSPQSRLMAVSAQLAQLLLVEPRQADFVLPKVALDQAPARTELLYFMLSRAQLVDEVIRPKLSQGVAVICDRYTPSSIAYQGYGRGLDLELIRSANAIATQGLEPDLIVLLDIPPEEGLARRRAVAQGDRFEKEELAFHRRVRDGYLKMAKADPQRWLKIDAALPGRQIGRLVWERVEQILLQTP